MGGVAPEATPPTRQCQREGQLSDLAAQWSQDSLPLTSLLSLTTTTMKSWNFTTFLQNPEKFSPLSLSDTVRENTGGQIQCAMLKFPPGQIDSLVLEVEGKLKIPDKI